MNDERKTHWRKLTIDQISQKCLDSGNAGIVAAYFMLWPENQAVGQQIYTKNDMATYTHIVYLDVPTDLVAQRRLEDREKVRQATSAAHLRKWQQAEKVRPRDLCRSHHSLFSVLSPNPVELSP